MKEVKQILGKVGNVLGWIFNGICVLALIIAVFAVITAKVNNTDVMLFNHKPFLVLTGSMEPTMMTHSICIAKKIDDPSTVEKDDIITYEVFDALTNQPITVTHRVYNIKTLEDGTRRYIMKGDNNQVSDNYELYDENLKYEVVYIWNGSADIIAKWNSGIPGKIMVLSPIAIILLVYWAVKMFFADDEEEEEKKVVVEVEAKPVIPTTPVMPIEQPTNFMPVVNKIRCEVCGNYYDETQAFCGHCGSKKPVKTNTEKIECPECGHTYDENMSFCPYCGTKKPEKIKCKTCGHQFYSNMSFCGYCGTPKPYEINCVCGHTFDSDMSFCPYCGTKKPEKNNEIIEVEAIEVKPVIELIEAQEVKEIIEVETQPENKLEDVSLITSIEE